MKADSASGNVSGIATILSATRRHVFLLHNSAVVEGRVAQRGMPLVVGDTVEYSIERGEVLVRGKLARKNCLLRYYHGKPREVAANLSQLLIIAAVQPLFNTVFIDRVMAALLLEGVPYRLVVNKTDLGVAETQPLIDIYERLGVPVIYSSAKTPEGVRGLTDFLAGAEVDIVAVCGVSGVGKSALINRLVPDAAQRTAEVSAKTGQGRQTTTQAFAYPYAGGKFIIDLPGIQSFGLPPLDPREVSACFTEIAEYGRQCEYSDCLHTAEPNCAVQDAIERGEIAESRYESYVGILAEIEAARPY